MLEFVVSAKVKFKHPKYSNEKVSDSDNIFLIFIAFSSYSNGHKSCHIRYPNVPTSCSKVILSPHLLRSSLYEGKEVLDGKVVEHLVQLKNVAKEVKIPVFYSPHMYTKKDYADWKDLNAIDKIMFANKMFIKGTWGHQFHPKMKPDENTVVMNPHKSLSNFWTGDAVIQLRQHGITTIIITGMSANMCVESHSRDAIENGFKVIIVADATAGAGPYAKKAALINYEFIGHEVVTTAQIIKRLREAKVASD